MRTKAEKWAKERLGVSFVGFCQRVALDFSMPYCPPTGAADDSDGMQEGEEEEIDADDEEAPDSS